MASSSSKATVFRAIAHARRSAKRFQTNRTIDVHVLQDILQSSIRSPSSFNLQPTQIIMVQDTKRKQELADTAMLGMGNQFRTRDCSVLAVFLSDLEASKRIQRIYDLEQGKRHPAYLAMMPVSTSFLLGEGHLATMLKQVTTDMVSELGGQAMPQIEPIHSWSSKNTALVVQSYVLAATSHNLATCVMEGFDARRVQEILRIPDRYCVPMVVATGYDYDEGTKDDEYTPRLDLDEVVFADEFGAPFSVNDDDMENDSEVASGS